MNRNVDPDRVRIGIRARGGCSAASELQEGHSAEEERGLVSDFTEMFTRFLGKVNSYR